jgi:hypothetical protein
MEDKIKCVTCGGKGKISTSSPNNPMGWEFCPDCLGGYVPAVKCVGCGELLPINDQDCPECP